MNAATDATLLDRAIGPSLSILLLASAVGRHVRVQQSRRATTIQG